MATERQVRGPDVVGLNTLENVRQLRAGEGALFGPTMRRATSGCTAARGIAEGRAGPKNVMQEAYVNAPTSRPERRPREVL